MIIVIKKLTKVSFHLIFEKSNYVFRKRLKSVFSQSKFVAYSKAMLVPTLYNVDWQVHG
jgi:hypothetical protein